MIFITTLLGFVFKSNAQLMVSLLQYLSTTLPGSAFELIRTVIAEITRSSGSGKLTFGILAALWTANSRMNALGDALNAVYKVKESRPLWKTYGIGLILTVLASLLIIAALTVFLYGGALVQVVSNTVGLKPAFYWSWKIAQWPIALFFVSLVASMVYYAAPNVRQRRWQWLSPGAFFATLGWIAASGLLRLYFHFFTNYAKTYGSLGAVMVLLTWPYVTGTMLLLRAEMNMVIETAAVRADAVPPEDQPLPKALHPQTRDQTLARSSVEVLRCGLPQAKQWSRPCLARSWKRPRALAFLAEPSGCCVARCSVRIRLRRRDPSW
jgi:membrane protein